MVRDPAGAAFLPRPVGLFRRPDGTPAFLVDPAYSVGALARARDARRAVAARPRLRPRRRARGADAAGRRRHRRDGVLRHRRAALGGPVRVVAGFREAAQAAMLELIAPAATREVGAGAAAGHRTAGRPDGRRARAGVGPAARWCARWRRWRPTRGDPLPGGAGGADGLRLRRLLRLRGRARRHAGSGSASRGRSSAAERLVVIDLGGLRARAPGAERVRHARRAGPRTRCSATRRSAARRTSRRRSRPSRAPATPRRASPRCRAGMINSIGLPGPGIDRFRAEVLPATAALVDVPIIVSVGGFSHDDYVRLAERADGELDAVAALELNLSCPNVKSGCISIGTDPRETRGRDGAGARAHDAAAAGEAVAERRRRGRAGPRRRGRRRRRADAHQHRARHGAEPPSPAPRCSAPARAACSGPALRPQALRGGAGGARRGRDRAGRAWAASRRRTTRGTTCRSARRRWRSARRSSSTPEPPAASATAWPARPSHARALSCASHVRGQTPIRAFLGSDPRTFPCRSAQRADAARTAWQSARTSRCASPETREKTVKCGGRRQTDPGYPDQWSKTWPKSGRARPFLPFGGHRDWSRNGPYPCLHR